MLPTTRYYLKRSISRIPQLSSGITTPAFVFNCNSHYTKIVGVSSHFIFDAILPYVCIIALMLLQGRRETQVVRIIYFKYRTLCDIRVNATRPQPDGTVTLKIRTLNCSTILRPPALCATERTHESASIFLS